MSQRRRRIVGIQAAAVAVLVVLVYVALLRPEDPGPLKGIQAPGGEETTHAGNNGPGGGPERKHRGKKRGTGSNSGNANGGGGAVAFAGGLPPGVAGPLGVPSGAPSGNVLAGQTPSDDQYADSVKALLDKLGSAGSPVD